MSTDSPQIYKSNALIEASYRLSVAEQRIMLACIAQVRRDEPITDAVLYSVSAQQIAEMSGTSPKQAYRELQEAALRLKRREVRLTQEPNGQGSKRKVMVTGWVQTIFYVEAEGRVELRFTRDMLPYLSELTEQFTRYALADVAKMTSAHAIRLYELLAQWGGIGEREIAIEFLREAMQLGDSYPVFKDLKRRVIEPAVAQINDHSPLAVTWEPRKTGRRVTHLAFTFGAKKKTAKRAKPRAAVIKPAAAGALTDAELRKHARPGETWEQLRARLNADRATA